MWYNRIIKGGSRLATKREKRSELRKQTKEEFEQKTQKKELMSKEDKTKWALFGIVLFCLWILANFSA